MIIYLTGSLRNPRVPEIANALRSLGHEVFDDWYAAGPRADDHWQDYETARYKDYSLALDGYAAKHTYQYDLHHLNRSNAGLLLLPAGKSAHLEFGYLIGQGKLGYVLFDEGAPERWDVMYKFATEVFFNEADLLSCWSLQ